MIFNSISKQLNNQPIREHQYRPSDYHPTPITNSRLSNSNYMHSSRMDSESSLSQMNQKLMNNIQYLKFKDVSRDNLKGSRVSNKSNKSNKSHHSNYSLQRSTHSIKSKPHVVEVASKWRFNDVKTAENEHYFPQRSAVIRPQFSNWETPVVNKMSSSSHPYRQKQTTQYRQMLKKPITIEEYNSKYGVGHPAQRKIPEKDNAEEPSFRPFPDKNEDNLQFQMFQNNSGREQQEKTRVDKFISTSPPEGRDWIHSFGQKFNNSDTPVTAICPQSTKAEQKPSKSSLFSSQKVSSPQVKSPLPSYSPPPPPKKKKQGMIIAAVLIALGLMLFIVQISK